MNHNGTNIEARLWDAADELIRWNSLLLMMIFPSMATPFAEGT